MKPTKGQFPPLKKGGKGGFSGTGARKSPSIPLFQRGKVAFEQIHCSREGGYHRESGSTLVEFGIVLVLLIALTLGVVDGARLIWDYSVLSNAVSEGVRCASVRGTDSHTASPCIFPVGTCSATDYTCVVQKMAVGLVPSPTVWVPCQKADGTAVTCPAKQGQVVRINAQYSFSPVTPLYRLGSFTLNTSSEMMTVR